MLYIFKTETTHACVTPSLTNTFMLRSESKNIYIFKNIYFLFVITNKVDFEENLSHGAKKIENKH